jgi:thymidylate kinase
MIIEFIGCTGAGKTTLISEVQTRLAKTTQVTTSFDLVAAPLGLNIVTSRMIRNFIQEIAVLPIFIRTWRRNKAVITFVVRMLRRHADRSIFFINNLRGIERNIGVFEKIKGYKNNCIILVDEGTVHLAHKVFVFNDAGYTSDEITQFANLIPVPDMIVYLRAPIENIILRTLNRSDPPREIRKNRHLTKEYINRAVAMFEQIIQAENIKQRLLIVENPDFNGKDFETVAAFVAQVILNLKTSGQLAHEFPPQYKWKNYLQLENSLKN